MINAIILPTLYWSFGFLISSLVAKKYKKLTAMNNLYFLIISAIGFYLFRKEFSTFFDERNYLIFLIVLISNMLFAKFVYLLGKKYGTKPKKLIDKNTFMDFLLLDDRFILGKPLEVLFQQIAVYALIINLMSYLGNNSNIILLGSLIFGLFHSPILILKGNFKDFSYPFLLFSFFIGGLFTYLIVLNPTNFIYTFTIHLQLYVLSGLGFWLWRRFE